MNIVWKERLRQRWPLAIVFTSAALVGIIASIFTLAAEPNTSVDFSRVTTALTYKPFSSTISTYGQTPITTSAQQRTALGNLGLGLYRVPLQWNNGAIRSAAAGGGDTSGDAWIGSIKNLGAEPMVVVGGTADNNFSAADAANLVRHYNTNGGSRVAYWVIGNEPGNGGMSIEAYCSLFNASYDAMKAVDPTIKIAGPAWAYYDAGLLQKFLDCAGSRVDIIDYHHYAMGEKALDNATALSQTGQWQAEVRAIREIIVKSVPARANAIDIQVGEYNWSWRTENGYGGWQGDDRFYQSIATVWAASVAGNIAQAGGRGHLYADLNGGLGLTFEKQDAATRYGRQLTDLMPVSQGIRMFSGGNLFRVFGDKMVSATTTVPNVEVYAANNKNVVMINKDAATSRDISLKVDGFTTGTVDIWQTNKDAPFDAPKKVTTAVLSSNLVSFTLPAYTVATLVFQEGSTPPAPAPTPTPTPTPTPSQLTVPIRINAGGSSYTDPSGTIWRADTGYTGGATDAQAAGKAIAKTTTPAIYQDERWGTFNYALPIANGTYKLRLHFAEIYEQCKVAGCRVFNVHTEGAPWLTNLDIAGEVGSMTALTKEQTVTVADGTLSINFTGVKGSPQLAAIEVLAADAAPAPAPTPTPTPTPTPAAGGLQASYFSNKNLTGDAKTRTDQTIDFSWGGGAPMTGIPANQFSTRWTGYLVAPKDETYTFYLTGDDGVRMWLDGKQIINGWLDQSSKEYKASVTLQKGKAYSIKVEYYESYGDAVAKLAWSSASTPRQIIPASVFRAASANQGFATTYYSLKGTNSFDSAIYQGSDAQIMFATTNQSFRAGLPADRFGVRWSGMLTPAVTGKYTLTSESDDGVRVSINNRLLIDRWNDHAPTKDSADIDLEAGKSYPITVEYYENYGGATMRLLWSLSGKVSEPLGDAVISH